MNRVTAPWGVVIVAGALVLLSACGGSDSAAEGQAAAATQATSSADAGHGPGGQENSEELQKISECLTAAGIAMPTRPSGEPSGKPSGAPSDKPTGEPSGNAGARPSGTRGAGGGMYADPTVKAALDACGISAPTGGGPADASGSPAVSATASS